MQQIKGLDIPKLTKSLVLYCRNVMAEYVYIGAGMNVSIPPVLRKWIASVEVVS